MVDLGRCMSRYLSPAAIDLATQDPSAVAERLVPDVSKPDGKKVSLQAFAVCLRRIGSGI